MARLSYPSRHEPLPAALPPGERTVGQLVAESIKLYGRRFWLSLPLGLPLAVLDWVTLHRSVGVQTLILWAFGPALTLAYVGASALAYGRPPLRAALAAFAAGLVVFLPFPVLYRLYVLPGVALFGMFGLAVPAAVVERLSVRAALRRGLELGRADAVHAVGSIATLAIVYGVSRYALVLLLRAQGDQAQEIAAFLADLVLSPLLFLGAALLYRDQAARVTLAARD